MNSGLFSSDLTSFVHRLGLRESALRNTHSFLNLSPLVKGGGAWGEVLIQGQTGLPGAMVQGWGCIHRSIIWAAPLHVG